MSNRNTVKADIALMEGELHLDGLNTHITRMGGRCALFKTPYQKKVAAALSAVRKARYYIREVDGGHQQTISTRGWKFNHHKRWDAQYRKKNWECGLDGGLFAASPEKGLTARCWHCGKDFIKRKECPECRLIVCPHCSKCGCQLTPEARQAVWITLNAVFRTDYWTPMLEAISHE